MVTSEKHNSFKIEKSNVIKTKCCPVGAKQSLAAQHRHTKEGRGWRGSCGSCFFGTMSL